MQIEIDPFTGVVTLLALAFSIFAAFNSSKNNYNREKRLDYIDIELKFVDLELSLKDNPGALKYHGIDIEDLKNDGISMEEFSYLLANFTTGGMDYRETTFTSKDVVELSEYRVEMLKSPHTRKAWPYIRKAMTGSKFTELVDEKIIEFSGNTDRSE